MKYIPPTLDSPLTIELTRRNLETLLAKLDDPASVRTIANNGVMVRAVENDEHYSDRPAGEISMPSRDITRVDVIGETVEEFWADSWTTSIQDNSRTLKLFAEGDGKTAKRQRDKDLADALMKTVKENH